MNTLATSLSQILNTSSRASGIGGLSAGEENNLPTTGDGILEGENLPEAKAALGIFGTLLATLQPSELSNKPSPLNELGDIVQNLIGPKPTVSTDATEVAAPSPEANDSYTETSSIYRDNASEQPASLAGNTNPAMDLVTTAQWQLVTEPLSNNSTEDINILPQPLETISSDLRNRLDVGQQTILPIKQPPLVELSPESSPIHQRESIQELPSPKILTGFDNTAAGEVVTEELTNNKQANVDDESALLPPPQTLSVDGGISEATSSLLGDQPFPATAVALTNTIPSPINSPALIPNESPKTQAYKPLSDDSLSLFTQTPNPTNLTKPTHTEKLQPGHTPLREQWQSALQQSSINTTPSQAETVEPGAIQQPSDVASETTSKVLQAGSPIKQDTLFTTALQQGLPQDKLGITLRKDEKHSEQKVLDNKSDVVINSTTSNPLSAPIKETSKAHLDSERPTEPPAKSTSATTPPIDFSATIGGGSDGISAHEPLANTHLDSPLPSNPVANDSVDTLNPVPAINTTSIQNNGTAALNVGKDAGNIQAGQVTQQVSDATVAGAQQGQSSVQLILNPESLGTVRIQLTQRGAGGDNAQQLQARMVVSSTEAHDMLVEQLDTLRHNLSDHNIHLDKFQIVVADSQGSSHQFSQNNRGDGAQHSFGQGRQGDLDPQEQQHGQTNDQRQAFEDAMERHRQQHQARRVINYSNYGLNRVNAP